MSSTALRRAAPLVFPARGKHTATVIFCHGLGDTAAGWSEPVKIWQQDQRLEEIKFILPNAPIRPVTLNDGMLMPAWWDAAGFFPRPASDYKLCCVNVADINESSDYLQSIVKDEISTGIPSDRIVLGGFSQGSIISLGTALIASVKLAGVASLSCMIKEGSPQENLIRDNDVNKAMPIFLGHGDMDKIICIEGGRATEAFLKRLGYTSVTFKTYSGLEHSTNMAQLADVATFLAATLPPKEQ